MPAIELKHISKIYDANHYTVKAPVMVIVSDVLKNAAQFGAKYRSEDRVKA